MFQTRAFLRQAVLTICIAGSVHGQSRIIIDSLYAPSIHATKSYTVLLPQFLQNGTRYAVLYLLHGYGGGPKDWVDRTDIEEYVNGLPLIVVMPDGENSWYVNSASDSSLRFEEYIVSDLIRAVNTRYPIDTTRQAIAGLSMGGHGALLMGMKHPDLFRFAASFSGAFAYPRLLNDPERQSLSLPLRASIVKAFGSARSEHWRANDVFEAYKSLPPERAPYMYLAAGIQDGFKSFLGLHRELTDSLRAHAIAYEYHETPGGHDWKYWDREIRKMLPRVREILKF